MTLEGNMLSTALAKNHANSDRNGKFVFHYVALLTYY